VELRVGRVKFKRTQLTRTVRGAALAGDEWEDATVTFRLVGWTLDIEIEHGRERLHVQVPQTTWLRLIAGLSEAPIERRAWP
jgi:hypothetical protein